MKKLAIFAEGKTEQAFLERLLIETAGKNNINIRKGRMKGGGKSGPRQISLTPYTGTKGTFQYYAIIYDCGADNRVTSDIRDSYDGLCNEKYDCIIGMRDARGADATGKITPNDVHRIRPRLKFRLRTKPIDPVMVLAVMETEAWFLAEYTHFAAIDPALTPDRVASTLSFDPRTGDVEQRPTPAEDIHAVYQTVGKEYVKQLPCIQRTVKALDYDIVFLDLPARVPAIKPLIEAVNAFLS